jgi:hypothetical protein
MLCMETFASGQARRTRAEAPPAPYFSISIPAVAIFSDLLARLDPDPRVRGAQFERICQWFLNQRADIQKHLAAGLHDLVSRRTSDVPAVSPTAT